MKKAIVIFFCLQILSANTFAAELVKLPALIHHYFEHEKEDHPDLGFGTFLWEHYVVGDHEDEEKGHCDEELPFKHCNDCCTHVVATGVYLIPDNSLTFNIPLTVKEISFDGDQQFISYYDCCIWQPPQIG